MFLRIGTTFINQDRIEYMKIYVESDTKEEPLGVMNRVKYCIDSPFVSTIDVPYYKAVIEIKSEEIQKWIIHAYSGEDYDKVKEKVEYLRQKLFENLGIHNIRIDLDTGEIIC